MKQKTLLNSYLISVIINLVLLLSLSFFSDYSPIPNQKDDADVQFVSLPKGRVLPRHAVSIDKQTNQVMTGGIEQNSTNAKYLNTATYRTIIRELAPISQEPDFADSIDKLDLDNLASSKLNQRFSRRNSSDTPLTSQKSRFMPSSKGEAKQMDVSRASIDYSGTNLKGYYNISLIKYEDSSDNISTDALYQLADGMNRWTQVKTKVIKKPVRLDDPKLVNVPFIYITSRRPFKFSERERQNLRRFFANGGFMMFSNIAESETQKLEVANSVGFELWKILGEVAHNLMEIEKSDPIYNIFFNLQKSPLPEILGITQNDRLITIYEDLGYGNAWISSKSGKREPYLEMGVNIIAYALTTNPDITGTR
jgi:hypothetical protein